MSDQIKSNREWVLDTVRKMDEVCAAHDFSWSDVLVHWVVDAFDCEPQDRLSKSSYYKEILLRDFFLCGDFDATLGIIVEAFLAGDVHQLAADNEKLLAEVTRLRARVEVLADTVSMLLENLQSGSYESEQAAIARARSVLGVPAPTRSQPWPWEDTAP